MTQDPHEPTCPHHSVGPGDHRGSDHPAPAGRPPDRLLRPRRESDNRCHPPDRTTHARRAGTRRRPRTHGPHTQDVLRPVTRRLISEASAKELAEPYDMSMAAVSKHLPTVQR